MKKAILATKVGMTQIFDENGVLVPVTVLQAGPCVVTQVKTADNDGYSAIQVGFGEKKENRVNKPMKGQFAKAGVSCKRYLKEFRFEDAETYTLGQEIKADIFGHFRTGDRQRRPVAIVKRGDDKQHHHYPVAGVGALFSRRRRLT